MCRAIKPMWLHERSVGRRVHFTMGASQYDFSLAEKGKFYHANAEFHFPVYLEPDVEEFVNRIALERQADVQVMVDEWLRASIKVLQSVPAGTWDSSARRGH